MAGLVFPGRWLELTAPREPVRLRGRPLPGLCPVLALTGRRCPGCGLTRAVLYLMRGEVRDAARANAVAPLVLVAAGAYAVWTRVRARVRGTPPLRTTAVWREVR